MNSLHNFVWSWSSYWSGVPRVGKVGGHGFIFLHLVSGLQKICSGRLSSYTSICFLLASSAFSLPSRRRGILYYSMNKRCATKRWRRREWCLVSIQFIFIFCIFCMRDSLMSCSWSLLEVCCRVCSLFSGCPSVTKSKPRSGEGVWAIADVNNSLL